MSDAFCTVDRCTRRVMRRGISRCRLCTIAARAQAFDRARDEREGVPLEPVGFERLDVLDEKGSGQ